MNDALERIQRSIDFIEAHLFSDLPLAAIAKPAAFSPWHFHRLFTAVTGDTPATSTHISELWAHFVPRIADVPHRRGLHTLGVCLANDRTAQEEAEFNYVAGVEVERTDDLPAAMIAIRVPANTYAVFTHMGHSRSKPSPLSQLWHFGRTIRRQDRR